MTRGAGGNTPPPADDGSSSRRAGQRNASGAARSGRARSDQQGPDRARAPRDSAELVPTSSAPDRTPRQPAGAARGGSGRGGPRLSPSTLWDEDGPQPLKARWDPFPTEEPQHKARPERKVRRRSKIGWFFHYYGWRAYALPVLIALTVVVVLQIASPSKGGGPSVASGSGTGAVTAPSTGTPATTVQVTVTPSSDPKTVTVQRAVTTTVDNRLTTITESGGLTGADPNGVFANVSAGALPPGADFAVTGQGTWHVVPGTSPPVGVGPTHLTYTVEVEDGIQNAADDQAFAASVVATLSDSRSWIGGGKFTLQRIDKGDPDFRISLTSQMTVRQPEYCGWDIPLEASCYNHTVGRVMINDARWVRGAVSFNGDLGSYRVYAINHEVGHALGYHHQPCGEDGGLAPVMMQQSWSTADDDLAKLDPGGPVSADGKVCKYNPFPFPRGGPAAAALSSSSKAAATSTAAATGSSAKTSSSG